MLLKPSNIFYSQDDISSTFGKCTNHSGKQIGTTLDDLYYGKIKVENIPKITVVRKDDGKWYTSNNRRLWIFHHLEGAGKCSEIEVIIGDSLSRFTTVNGGTSVTIYKSKDPGGECRRFITPVIPRKIENECQGSSSQNDKEDASKESEDKVPKPESNEVSNVGKTEDKRSALKLGGINTVGENVGKDLESKEDGSTDGDIEESEENSLKLEPDGFIDDEEDEDRDFESKRGSTDGTGDSEDKSFGSKVDGFTDTGEIKDQCFESEPDVANGDDGQASNTDADSQKSVLGEKRNLSCEDDNMEKPKRIKRDIP